MLSREIPEAPSVFSSDAYQDTCEAVKRKLPNTDALKTYSHDEEAGIAVRCSKTTEVWDFRVIPGRYGWKGKTSHTGM